MMSNSNTQTNTNTNTDIIIPETRQDEAKRKALKSEYSKRELILTPEQQEFVDTKLLSKLWRMNNLYKIRDKDGQLVTMRLNHSQMKVLTQYRHNKKIILKSRQQGISTLYLAYNLDDCLFKPGYSAGIQSYGLDESNKLQTRAQLMWDELDQDIKELFGLHLVSNNQKGMTFSNGAILKIGNFRGDTLQSLHVSELAKIAKVYPDKAKELKTGAFQAVSTKNKITIESTAEGENMFKHMWDRAILRSNSSRALTSLDFMPIFLSWKEDPDCSLSEEYPISASAKSYMEKYKLTDLTLQQQWWLSAKMEELGDDFNQEYPLTPELAFQANIDGMYFRHQYTRLLDSNPKRITTVPYNPEYLVHVSFDLGLNDEMVMLFAQVINGQPYIIDEYHNREHGIDFYCDILSKKPYVGNYAPLILPHDANQRDLSTGRTRIEAFRRNGFRAVKLLKKLSFADSIEGARQFIDTMIIDDRCDNTLMAIQNYRKKYDKHTGLFLSTDVHDIHSNYAASLRYLAQGLTYHKVKQSKPKTLEQQYRDYKATHTDGYAI